MTAHSSNLRRGAGVLGWLLNPFRATSVPEIYDLIATDAISENGLYLNLGDWRSASSIDEACTALVHRLGVVAGLGAGDEVVDVGFGFGDQDIYWARHFAPARITGLNITRSQVDVARRRVAEEGLEDRVDLRHGSATAMPFPDASADIVLGLECAFHFDTRAAFLHEAGRVLRSGGRLALGDIIPAPPSPSPGRRAAQRVGWSLTSRIWNIPRANADTPESYRAKLRGAGFTNIRIESIRADVFVPLHRYVTARPELVRRYHPLLRLPFHVVRRADPERLYSGLDYVLVSAEKPA